MNKHLLHAVGPVLALCVAASVAPAAHADGDYEGDGTWERTTYALQDARHDGAKGAEIVKVRVTQNEDQDFGVKSHGYYIVTLLGSFNASSRFTWQGTGETATGTADQIRFWKNSKGRLQFTIDGLGEYRNRCGLSEKITLKDWTRKKVRVRIPFECAEPDVSYVPKDKRYFVVKNGRHVDRTRKKVFEGVISGSM